MLCDLVKIYRYLKQAEAGLLTSEQRQTSNMAKFNLRLLANSLF